MGGSRVVRGGTLAEVMVAVAVVVMVFALASSILGTVFIQDLDLRRLNEHENRLHVRAARPPGVLVDDDLDLLPRVGAARCAHRGGERQGHAESQLVSIHRVPPAKGIFPLVILRELSP